MNENDARAALEAWLKTLTPAIPIIWQEKTPPKGFDPTAAYCKAFLMPAKNQSLGIKEKTTLHTGIFQVTLCYPTGNGTGDANAQAAAIQAHFPAGLVLTSNGAKVRIKGKPSIAGQTSQSPLTLPVSIRYQTIF